MSSMTYVQVVAVDCAYHSPCVVIGTENSRFLFEVGEGAQRQVIEHKVRIGKIGGIFLTSSSPYSLGGLPGMMLTIDDTGCSQLDIYGPCAAQHYLNGTRNFMRQLGNFHAVSVHPSSQRVICKKKNELTITAVPIRASARTCTDADDAIYQELGHRVSYIAETPVIPGKFYIDRAAELNIPKGPMYGKLKNGQSITLEDGTVITPDQVLGPPYPSQYLAVISRLDLQDEIMVDSLFSSSDYQLFYHGNSNSMKRFHIMVHLSSADVIRDTRYQQWISRFGPSTKHLFVGLGMSSTPVTSFIAQTKYNIELNSLFSSIFPLVVPNTSSPESLSSLAAENFIIPTNSMKYHILPQKRVGEIDDCVPLLDAKSVMDTFEAQSHQNAPLELAKAKELGKIHDALRTNRPLCEDDVSTKLVEQGISDLDIAEMSRIPSKTKFIFLGTGCAIPSKYRNVSGILLYLPKDSQSSTSINDGNVNNGGSMLLDVGEGSWFQLMNLLPPDYDKSSSIDCEKIALSWSLQIKLVWISHPHADHHLGLITIIQERSKTLLKHGIEFQPLVVIAPYSIGRFLDHLVTNLYPEMKGDFVFISNSDFDPIPKVSNPVTQWNNNGDSRKEILKDAIAVICKPCDGSELSAGETTTVSSGSSKRLSKKARLSSSQEAISSDVPDEVIEESGKPRMDANAASKTTSGFAPVSNRPSRPPLPPTSPEDSLLCQNVFQSLGVVNLTNIPVIHCSQSYGIILTLEGQEEDKPWKLVYSGDTRPCEQLVTYGTNATILIHEATFEEDKLTEAMSKKHSTIAEAVQIANEMNATRLILTHFSQRYHGVPMQFHPNYFNMLSPEVLQSLQFYTSDKSNLVTYDRTTIAFDFMHLTPQDLLWSPQITPLLACLFPAVVQESEEDELMLLN